MAFSFVIILNIRISYFNYPSSVIQTLENKYRMTNTWFDCHKTLYIAILRRRRRRRRRGRALGTLYMRNNSAEKQG